MWTRSARSPPAWPLKFEQRVLRYHILYIAINGCPRLLHRMGMIDMHISCWHDRRYRMFVDHLADIILEQHDKLIEGFYLPLELDSVHQEN